MSKLRQTDPELHQITVEICVEAYTRLQVASDQIEQTLVYLESLKSAGLSPETRANAVKVLDDLGAVKTAVHRLRLKL